MTRVSLQSHEAVWSDRFVEERERIERTLSVDCEVFHIGSTAIPDVPTKDTLDAVAVFGNTDVMQSARNALLDDGFGCHRDDPEWVVLTRSGSDYGVCLHLRPLSHPRWRDQVVFREYLRDDRRARARYERAKQAAAADHPDDVSAYTDAKEPVILTLTEEAYDCGYGERVPAVDL